MMGGLRAFAQSWAGKAVLIFLAFMLLGSGVLGSMSLLTTNSLSAGIKADGQNIDELEIATQARTSFRDLGRTFERLGQELDTKEAFERIGLLDQVREATEAQLVNEVAFKSQAANMRIAASSEDLTGYIEAVFTDHMTGAFSESRMARALMANGRTERGYLREVSEEIASTRLFEVADDIAFPENDDEPLAAAPDVHAMAQFNTAWTRYDVTHFSINGYDIDLPSATDAELRAIQEENPDDYQRPEYREFVGIFLTPEDLIPTIEVTEEDIQTAYENYVAQLETQTEWELRQLVVNDFATANQIVKAVREGQAFEDAAMAYGASAPTDLGFRSITYGRAAVNEAFTATTEIGILDPIEDNNRYTLIEIYGIDKEEPRPSAEYRQTAIEYIAGPQASTVLNARFAELDGLVGSMTLEEAAAMAELPVVSGKVAQSGRDARVEGLPSNSKITTEIFTAPVGAVGFRNSYGQEGLFIVRVDSVEEARPMTFEEAKPDLVRAFDDTVRMDMLTGLGQVALSQISDIESLREYADAAGLEVESAFAETPAELLRSGLPVDAIRSAAAGDIVGGGNNARYDIVLLSKIHPADPERDAEALETIRYRLAVQYDDAMQRAYRTAVRETVNVQINDRIFERAIESGLNAYLDMRSGGYGQIRIDNPTSILGGGYEPM
ncbi:MAG: peptidyl-prolyl cis-trans isomerase [Alphaproteobacteria bacterium TMED89]|nr:hypothetical protein [Rhodospirillaceae bacterium]RPH16742.1 MAG: peptidyl-prolyl cis-trans isomerase [Alphaproteobacteria bacterium TMED89]